MKIRSGRIFTYIPFADKERAKMIDGWKWHKEYKNWSWPLSVKGRIAQIFPNLKAEIETRLAIYYKALKETKEVKTQVYNKLKINTAIFKRAPYDHQIEMIKRMILNNKFALLCEMGTGKTQAGINTFEYLYREGSVKRCLIVTKKSIVDNWQEEIRINSDFKSIIIRGTRTQKIKQLETQGIQFYIINYEGLIIPGSKSKGLKTRPIKSYPYWNKFNMIIPDESSKLKNHKAKRTEIIIEIFRDIKYKYLMTGTPVTQSPMDLFAQFNFLDPGILSHWNHYEFKEQYCTMGGYQNKEIVGYKNLDNLKNRIAHNSIQLKKEDCNDLPDKIYTRRILEMTPALADQYKEMFENFVLDTGKEKLSAISKSGEVLPITWHLRLHQIVSGAYLSNQKENAKLQELEDIIQDNLYNGNQIIVWCRFLKSMNMIREVLSAHNIPYSELRGATVNRKEEIDNFQSGKTKIFLGQLESGGMGINLTAGNIVVYYENTFSLENRLQSESRAHRIGQTRKVVYIDLIYKNTIDLHILKAIQSKQDIAKYLVKCFKPGEYTNTTAEGDLQVKEGAA